MSYDIEVFSTEKPTAPASEEGRDWQIAVDGPLNVEPEDIPAQVRALLPGLRFVTQFYLEGNASSSAQKKLLTMARGVARSARGIVVDQQQGTVGLFSSWFVEDIAFSEFLTDMLDLFQRTIPEVLPRRYGLWEPPQFKLATDGIGHLRDFLAKNLRDTVVWYCHKPCQYVFKSIPDRVGATPRGFRCGRRSPGGGWHSTSSPSAVLIGKPYAELWPDFVSAARRSSTGLHYLEQFVEAPADDAGNRIPSPPSNISQPPEPARQTVFDPSKPEDRAFTTPRSQASCTNADRRHQKMNFTLN